MRGPHSNIHGDTFDTFIEDTFRRNLWNANLYLWLRLLCHWSKSLALAQFPMPVLKAGRLGYASCGRKVCMTIASIIAELDAEISRLEQARALLGQLTPKASKPAPATKNATAPRKMSAAARERIAAAQRKRWAKQKAITPESAPAAKKSAPVKPQPSQMSAAGRKRIAAAQKKRWAAIKAAKTGKPRQRRKATLAKTARPAKKVSSSGATSAAAPANTTAA